VLIAGWGVGFTYFCRAIAGDAAEARANPIPRIRSLIATFLFGLKIIGISDDRNCANGVDVSMVFWENQSRLFA
jgi:hypothetical protein